MRAEKKIYTIELSDDECAELYSMINAYVDFAADRNKKKLEERRSAYESALFNFMCLLEESEFV